MNSQEKTVSVQTTATVVAPANPKRLSLVLSNLGANDIFVSLTQAATATSGILVPNGVRPVILDRATHGTRIENQLSGIAATGATNLSVVEHFS